MRSALPTVDSRPVAGSCARASLRAPWKVRVVILTRAILQARRGGARGGWAKLQPTCSTRTCAPPPPTAPRLSVERARNVNPARSSCAKPKDPFEETFLPPLAQASTAGLPRLCGQVPSLRFPSVPPVEVRSHLNLTISIRWIRWILDPPCMVWRNPCCSVRPPCDSLQSNESQPTQDPIQDQTRPTRLRSRLDLTGLRTVRVSIRNSCKCEATSGGPWRPTWHCRHLQRSGPARAGRARERASENAWV